PCYDGNHTSIAEGDEERKRQRCGRYRGRRPGGRKRREEGRAEEVPAPAKAQEGRKESRRPGKPAGAHKKPGRKPERHLEPDSETVIGFGDAIPDFMKVPGKA